VVAGEGGAWLPDEPRGLRPGCQVHTGAGDGRPERDGGNRFCQERGQVPQQVVRWTQAAQDSNAQLLLTLAD
jgi:hypothetical protein